MSDDNVRIIENINNPIKSFNSSEGFSIYKTPENISAASKIENTSKVLKEDTIVEVSKTVVVENIKENKNSVALESVKENNLENNNILIDNSLSSIAISSIEEKKKTEKSKFSMKKEKQVIKLEILKKLSAGTGLREGLNDIVKGGMGALILISNENSSNVFQGGFKINTKFTSKKLMELAKMDGAIVLSDDFKKILYANTLLTPNKNLSTTETGTRHQSGERTAKQIRGLVIAVSERRGTISVYFNNWKYVLQNTEELMRRTTETLQILEKQRDVFDELITNLNLLEFNNLVSIADVCTILERLEMMKKMTDIINEYMIELGKDGIILRMRMREITRGLDKKYEFIIKDYLPRPSRARQFFDTLSFENLLDLENIAETLFGKSLETGIIPKGCRILEKTSLSKNEIDNLIKNFKNLSAIVRADEESLRHVIKGNTKLLLKELSTLREHILVGKKI